VIQSQVRVEVVVDGVVCVEVVIILLHRNPDVRNWSK
jgi:hypothetical protein